MADEEEQLIEQARASRKETEKLREEGTEDDGRDENGAEAPEGEGPWAKTSSGDADSVTDDE